VLKRQLLLYYRTIAVQGSPLDQAGTSAGHRQALTDDNWMVTFGVSLTKPRDYVAGGRLDRSLLSVLQLELHACHHHAFSHLRSSPFFVSLRGLLFFDIICKVSSPQVDVCLCDVSMGPVILHTTLHALLHEVRDKDPAADSSVCLYRPAAVSWSKAVSAFALAARGLHLGFIALN
jgi:hypothetical protein